MTLEKLKKKHFQKLIWMNWKQSRWLPHAMQAMLHAVLATPDLSQRIHSRINQDQNDCSTKVLWLDNFHQETGVHAVNFHERLYAHNTNINNRHHTCTNLRDDLKKKSKKQDIVPLSVDPYPPTIKREVLIRDNFDFFFLPPTLLTEIGTFLNNFCIYK